MLWCLLSVLRVHQFYFFQNIGMNHMLSSFFPSYLFDLDSFCPQDYLKLNRILSICLFIFLFRSISGTRDDEPSSRAGCARRWKSWERSRKEPHKIHGSSSSALWFWFLFSARGGGICQDRRNPVRLCCSSWFMISSNLACKTWCTHTDDTCQEDGEESTDDLLR